MVFRSLLSALLLLLLVALLPASAHAAAWTIKYEPASPVAGDPVQFQVERANSGQGSGASLVWDFGDGGTGAGERPDAHVYAAAGEYTVTVYRPKDGTLTVEASAIVEVAPKPDPPNTPPSPAFSFAPLTPVVGDAVLFTGGSDADGVVESRLWAFGDGTTSSAVSPTHTYTAAGTYTASLTVTDDDGAFASTSRNVPVGPRVETLPPDDPGSPVDDGTPVDDGSTTGGSVGADPVTQQPAVTRLLNMSPFPIIRIAGTVLPRGARVRILSVRAPRGARVRVRCSGRGCPVASLARTSATRLLRLRRFERLLRAGIRLEIFVRKTGTIGKYTRFLIRAGKPPARVDRCLIPGRKRPAACR